jgi:hypothetical protein
MRGAGRWVPGDGGCESHADHSRVRGEGAVSDLFGCMDLDETTVLQEHFQVAVTW